MYREKLDEVRREKHITHKKWSEESGVSIDTISRIIHPDNPDKDSPKVNTLEDLCKPLGVGNILHWGQKLCISASRSQRLES